MKSLDEIRAFFAADLFAAEHGMRIEKVDEEGAVCSIDLQPRHMNAVGRVQGGLIYTLADFAFAVATNHDRDEIVTLTSTIHYLRTPQPESTWLSAEARCVRSGRTTCLYQTDIYDEQQRHIAQVNATGYRITLRAQREQPTA